MRSVFLLMLLLAAGCSSLLGPRPGVSLSLQSEAPLPADARLEITLGTETHLLPLDAGPQRSYRREVRAPRTGEVAVRALLRGGGARAEASFTQRFSAGHAHWVSAHLGTRRPLGHCIGALIAIPLDPALSSPRADTMFVVYGSIPEGAIC